MNKIKKSHITITVLGIVLLTLFSYLGFTFKQENKFFYKEKGTIDYKVYLKTNEDYSTKYLEKNRKYIASLIDHIDVDYNYKFVGDRYMDYHCNYYVLAAARVADSSDESKLIYKKEKYILEHQTKDFFNQSEININETVSLDYEEYNQIINDFTSKYNLAGTNNNLKLIFGINLTANDNSFETPITDTSELNLQFPLTTQTIAVSANYKDIDEKGEKVEVSSNKLWNVLFFILAIIFGALTFRMIFSLIKAYMKYSNEMTYYEKTKLNIINKFSKFISKVDNLSNFDLYKFVDIDNFIDLINIRDCLDKPILFTEFSEIETSWFLVIDGETAYRFILNNGNREDLK